MFLITTTGTIGTVTFDDLGEREFTHPTVSYDLQLEYSIFELVASNDIQTAIDNGYIIVSNGINNILTLSSFFMETNIYDSNSNNIIDDSEKLNGLTPSFYIDANNLTGTIPPSVISNSSLVGSVNGMTGSVILDSSDITENANLYYTDTRSRNALIGGTGINYNSTTGDIQADINDLATSSTTQLWSANQIENKFNSFKPLQLFDAYDNTGGVALPTGSWKDIPLHIERKKDSAYSHAIGSPEVVITEAGIYTIDGRFSANTSGNTRSSSSARMVIDTGAGYVEISGTLAFGYHRNATSGVNTCNMNCVLSLNVGDKIKLQGTVFSGPSTLSTIAGGSSIVITNNKGEKGESGPTGSGSNISVSKESLTIGTLTNELNFIGNGYTLTDGGGNITNVNISTSNDRAMSTSNVTATMTSATYVDVPDLIYTTKNLGGTGTYTINVSISRSHSASAIATDFAIEVDGVIIAESTTSTFNNEIHMIPMCGVVSGVASGSIIKVLSRTVSGSHTVLNRTMTIDGILDTRIAI